MWRSPRNNSDEGTKAQTAETLARVLDISLRLRHPFTPFVTEEIWGHLRSALGESSLKGIIEDWPEALIIATWPEPRPLEGWEESKTADFTMIQEIVRSIRNLRAEKNVPPSKRIAATIAAGASLGLIQEQSHVIAQLAGLNEAEMKLCDSLEEKPKDSVPLPPALPHSPLHLAVRQGRPPPELGRQVPQRIGPTGVNLHNVVSAAINPDSSLLAAAYDDNTIRIWEIATQQEVMSLFGHSGLITDLRFTPDGKLLISTSLDGTIRLWGVP